MATFTLKQPELVTPQVTPQVEQLMAVLQDEMTRQQLMDRLPKITFHELVAEIMREDLKSAERDELVKKHGFAVYNYHE